MVAHLRGFPVPTRFVPDLSGGRLCSIRDVTGCKWNQSGTNSPPPLSHAQNAVHIHAGEGSQVLGVVHLSTLELVEGPDESIIKPIVRSLGDGDGS